MANKNRQTDKERVSEKYRERERETGEIMVERDLRVNEIIEGGGERRG